MIEEAPQNTLHTAVEQAFDAVIPDAANPPAYTPESVPLPAEAKKAEAAPAEPAKADERPRGPDGKFIEKSAAAPATAASTPSTASAAPAPAAAAEPIDPRLTKGWKKEIYPIFEKIARGQTLTPEEVKAFAEHNDNRMSEFGKGVSLYKTQAERAKTMLEALEPHRADFERWGIDPGQQFSKYVEIHKGLALGSPEQKLGMLMRIAHDYQIPVERLFVQQDGQVYFNPQVRPAAPQPQPQQQQFTPQAIEKTVQAVIQRERSSAEIEAMAKDHEKYPHFETVRETMAQLLDAGIATDLPGAYETALSLPQHRELQQAALEQARLATEAARKAQEAAAAKSARAAAVSPKSATPATGAVQARKGLREALVENFETIGSSRV